jgi:hypothetical protein
VLPADVRDCVGCLPNPVKLIGALNQDLDEAMKEICHLGNHEEEANQRITKLETLYKQDGEVVEKLKKENATLERMVQFRDELIIEIAVETRLDRMGEDNDEDDSDEEDDDNNNGGDTVASPTVMPSPAAMQTAAATPELIIMEEELDSEETVPEQEATEALEVVLPEEEPEPLQPRLFTMLVRDHELSPLMIYDDLDDPSHAYYDVDESTMVSQGLKS